MKDLFFSEWRRLRLLAMVVGGAHLLLLLFINRMSDLLQQAYFESTLYFGAYMLLGLALAVFQVGSYRKPSQWLWLIHRPLSTDRIFGALTLAALAVLATAMLLPMLLLVLGTDLFTSKVVDSRHYLMLLHMLAFAMMAWLAGAHACVSRHKAAIAVLAAPVLLTLHLISVWWLLLPVSLSLAWLGFITLKSFRANREAPLPGTATLLLTALPLQLGLFLLVFKIGSLLFMTGSIMLGTDPLNTQFPPKGGLIDISRAEHHQEFLYGLEGSKDLQAASWREQLPLMEPARIGPWLQRFPIRHQLGNLNMPTQWWDETRKIMWTFSHDRMLFHGRDPQSGVDHGWWGVKGAGDTTAFAEIPFADERGYLLTRSTLYAIDKDQQRQHELLRLQAGESFVDAPRPKFNRLLVLTNQRVLAYRTDREATSPFAPPLLDWQQPLPRGAANLEGVAIAEMMDGWLLSFVYGEGMRQIALTQFYTAVEPWQQVVHIPDSGQARVVAERAIRRDFPVMQHYDWWFSPVLHTLVDWPDSALDKGLTWPLERELLPTPPHLYLVALALMLASLALAWWWLLGNAMSPGRRRLWLASCALLGLPGFLSLICLEPRARRQT